MNPVVVLLLLFLIGCTALPPQPSSTTAQTTSAAVDRYESLPPCPGKAEVILALSGGGSRAAVFATEFLLALDELPCRARDNITIVTGVSGGSIAAALYASSYDPPTPAVNERLVWQPATVRPLVKRPIGRETLFELAKPANALGYLTGSFTRTSALEAAIQRVLAGSGETLTFGDLNPRRPKTVISATVASDGESQVLFPFGGLFAFDRETFRVLEGDWDLSLTYEGKGTKAFKRFPVARAVAASAAFPAAFDFVTLFYPRTGPQSGGGGRYLHLFDGGNFDNLGLFAVKRALLQDKRRYLTTPEKLIIISVDAAGTAGASEQEKAPGAFVDNIGVNFTTLLSSFDALLLSKKDRILAEFRERRFQVPTDRVDCLRQGLGEICFDLDFNWEETNALFRDKATFIHFHFHSPETQNVGPANESLFICSHRDLVKRVDHIPTKLSITNEEAEDLRLLTALFMGEWNLCFGDFLSALGLPTNDAWRERGLQNLEWDMRGGIWLKPMQHLPSCDVPRPSRFITLTKDKVIDTRRTNEIVIHGKVVGEIRHAWSMMQSAIYMAELGQRKCPSISPEAGRERLWSAVQAGRLRYETK